MNIEDLSIIALASIIGLMYLLLIRRLDLYEKEPFKKLLMVTIAGGTISVITSLILYQLVTVHHNFADAVLKIGPIEEFSKLFALIIVFRYIKYDFNEIVDGLIYIAAISLGFSIIENIFYAMNYENSYFILFQRSLFSVIGHISFSGYLGLAFYIHIRVKENYTGILLSLVIASLAHGLYDAFLFQRQLTWLFKFLFYGIVVLQFIMFKLVLGFSRFKEKLSTDLFEQTDQKIFLVCAKCNNHIKEDAIKFRKIKGVICPECNSFVLHGRNISALFNYFRPVLKTKKYIKALYKGNEIKYLDKNKQVIFNKQRSVLSASLIDLSDWLEISNTEDRERIFRIPLIGILLSYLGLRYIHNK